VEFGADKLEALTSSQSSSSCGGGLSTSKMAPILVYENGTITIIILTYSYENIF